MTHLYSIVSILAVIIIAVSGCIPSPQTPSETPRCTKYASLPESPLWMHGNLITDVHFIDDKYISMSSVPFHLTEDFVTWTVDLAQQSIVRQTNISLTNFFRPVYIAK